MSNSPQEVKQAFDEVNQRIGEAAARVNRSADQVLLVAVTKYAGLEQIRTLVELGHRDFGESRAQVLAQHATEVSQMLPTEGRLAHALSRTEAATHQPRQDRDKSKIRWHMIGHLQRNKVKTVVPSVRLIHSVDTLRLADELQAFGLKSDMQIEVLLQVNCSGESQKYGMAPAAVPHLCEHMQTMVNVKVRGLMTMAAHSDNPEDARPAFARCHDIYAEIAESGVCGDDFNLLSMGMSGDFEVAIEQGANIVRVGSAIFGSDNNP